jgi:DNA repair protein RadC
MKASEATSYPNPKESGREAGPEGAALKSFERSPRLAEFKVAYRSRTKPRDRKAVRSPQDVVEYLRGIWNARTIELFEEFVVVCLNGAHEAVGWVKVSSGGLNAAQVDPRLVFAVALQTASTAIIVAHNHPSGSTRPSGKDEEVTRRLKEAGELLGVAVLDHVILTRESAFSFMENGLL